MLNRIFAIAALLVMFGTLQSCDVNSTKNNSLSSNSPIQIITSPKDTREYKTFTLENNMEVILVRDMSSEISAIALAVGVGQFQDPPQQQGLAHYLEHVISLGSDKYPEPNSLKQYIAQNSGKWNAVTYSDKTQYFFSLPGDKFDSALDMFSDLFKTPHFDPKYTEKERNAVNSEWSLKRNNDYKNLYHLSGITGNPQHPHHQLSVGTLETLSNKPGSQLHDELVSFYERNYSANIMKLAIVSNLSLTEQEALVKKHFSSIKDKGIKRPKPSVAGLTHAQMGKKIYYNSIQDNKLLKIEFSIPNNHHLWRHKPNQYLGNLITAKEPGTLLHHLRKNDLVKELNVHSYPNSFGNDGTFTIDTKLTSTGLKNREQVIGAIFAYLQWISKEGVNVGHYLAQKLKKQETFSEETIKNPLSTAIQLSKTLLYYPAKWVVAHDYEYEKFDPKAINAVLNTLTPERARIWYISQNENAENPIPFYEGKYSVKDISSEDIVQWRSLAATATFKLPNNEEIDNQESSTTVEATILKPKQIVDEPGLEVWLAHSKNFQAKDGRIDIVFNTELDTVNVHNYVLSKLLARVIIRQHKKQIINAEFDEANVKIKHDRNDLSIRLGNKSASHQPLIESIFTSLADWQVSNKDFEKSKSSELKKLIKPNTMPAIIQMLDFSHAQHFEKTWTIEEEQAAFNQVTLSQLLSFKEALCSTASLRVLAYGNYSEATVLAVADSIRKVLPASRKTTSQLSRRAFVTPHAGMSVKHNKVITGHANNALGDRFEFTEPSPSAGAHMNILQALMKNKFFTQLRTNEQLGYSVGIKSTFYNQYPGLMFMVQSDKASLPKVSARIDLFRQDFVTELQATNDDVIEQIKRTQRIRLTQRARKFKEEAGPLFADFHNQNLAFDSRQKLIDALSHVSKQSLIQFYKDIFLGNKGARTLVQVKGSDFVDTDFAR